MSPVGDQLRERCRSFPSLVNCCTLDWFDSWPTLALEAVAKQFLVGNKLMAGDNDFHKLFPIIHNSVIELSDLYFIEEKRNVYLTPKTFLDNLSHFKQVLMEKQQETYSQLTRLQNGIDKLNLTNQQIEALSE